MSEQACPDCKGSGADVSYDHVTYGSLPEASVSACGRCGGTGINPFQETPRQEITFSWDSLHEIESFKGMLSGLLRERALARTVERGRSSVTPEDVGAVLPVVLADMLKDCEAIKPLSP